MRPDLEALEAEALRLPESERTLLIERLVASLGMDPAIEAAWIFEVNRRYDEVKEGKTTLRSGSEALAKLKAEFS